MIHGILNVYKEKGYTSHDVVAKLRGITGQKKIGHTGTLDPEAVGVLPVCLGRATKLCGMLTDKDKCYETVLLLGIETDTQDITGKIQKEEDISGLEEAEVTHVVRSFTGEYEQIPPMYSALKVNGRKLYELAREGRTVERAARRVTVYGIEILEIHLPRVRMRVHCSKGTYIRTLCHDMGKRLGCCGCMEELIRTRVSGFRIEDSLSLSRLEEMGRNGTLSEAVLPIDQMFPDYQKLTENYYAYIAGRFPGTPDYRYITMGGYNLNRILGHMNLLHNPYCRFNFTSLISLMHPVDMEVPCRHRNRYREIMLKRELENQFWEILHEIRPEYLFLDFIEERFDVLSYGNGYLTKSDALEGAECPLENAVIIKRDSKECQLSWQGCRKRRFPYRLPPGNPYWDAPEIGS